MVATPSKIFAVPALAAACVALLGCQHAAVATSIEGNPVTITEVVVKMNDAHPAYGAPPRVELESVIPDNSDEERAAVVEITNSSAVEIVTSAASSLGARRQLEGAPTDMQKLEKFFGKKLVTNYNTLLKQYGSGEAKDIPWPASYWPIYLDSINYKWHTDEPSPAEKYAKAFGKNVKQFMDTVSQVNGVDSYRSNKKCSADGECASVGGKCAKRAGASSGYCIPTWYGICHAWAPASNWEPEPRCDVVKNGVTFRPYDLKGLITAVYDGAEIETVFTGSRFNGPDLPAPLDKYGRYQDAKRRDLGAGFFHLAISNIMGVNKHSFVVDVTAGAEVWNQPVRSYEVVKYKVLDPVAAGKEYFGTKNYPFNNAAKHVAYTKTRFSYIIESYDDGPLVPDKLAPYTTTVEYEYFVELDADYNIIGGEWLDNSRYEHPDFLWFATGAPNKNTVTSIGLSYKEVRDLIDQSVACKNSPTPKPTTTKPAVTTPAPTTNPPKTDNTPAPTKPNDTPAPSTNKPTKPTETPAPSSVKPSKPTETPAPSSAKPGEPTETPTPSDGSGKPTETPAPSTEKPGKPTETPAPSGGSGKPTQTPAPSSGKPGKPTETPAPSGGSGKPTETPAPSTEKPGKPTETPAPSGGSGKPTETPAPSGDSGKPTETPAPSGDSGKPTETTAPSTETPAPPSDKPSEGTVVPPSEDPKQVPTPGSGAGKPTTAPVPAVTPAATTSPTDGMATVTPPGGDDEDDDVDEIPTPAQTTSAPPSDADKGTGSPPSDNDDDSDDDDVPPSSANPPTVTPVTSSPTSGAEKPTPAPTTPASGDSASTPEPTKKKNKHKDCHA